jgi:hypothetical protein
MRRGGPRGLALGLAVGLLVAAAGMARPPAGARGGGRIGDPAPDLAGGPWLNSAPLSMVALRGRVVLVEFWTYG